MSAGRLLELSVADLALIERLRLELAPGLNVFTGETGAGKSLLIDALGLAPGARADTTLVRHGAETARVEALFDRMPEPLIAVREVAVSGRSTARLDDEAVTAARLADVAGPLVEIHGQHDQQRLLDERWQRDLLDAFGGHAALRAAMAEAVERWRANRAALAELELDPRELARRLELSEHEAAEIAAARLRPGEAAEIRGRLEAAQHGEAIARGASTLHDALAGGGGRRPGGGRDRRSARRARWPGSTRASSRSPSGSPGSRPSSRTSRRRPASSSEAVDHDPGRAGAARGAALDDLRARAPLRRRRGRGHRPRRAGGRGSGAAARPGRRSGADAPGGRGAAARRGRRAPRTSCRGARRGRRAPRRARSAAVLEELGFAAGVFEVGLGPATRPAATSRRSRSTATRSRSTRPAIDEVVFRLAPNPGEPPRPLAKIASGGELSRVALAIKQVLAAADDTPTLVFDEVDTGIGGRSADPVGRSLWALARRHQVLCVTHLPQIAAHADAHFQIAKRERDGRTVTEVTALDREGRIVELAQMLGGSGGGSTALASAARARSTGRRRWRAAAGDARLTR